MNDRQNITDQDESDRNDNKPILARNVPDRDDGINPPVNNQQKILHASPPAGEDHGQEFTQDTGENKPDQKTTNKDHIGVSETATA